MFFVLGFGIYKFFDFDFFRKDNIGFFFLIVRGCFIIIIRDDFFYKKFF